MSEALRAANRFLVWVALAERYVFPNPDSITGLAGRLRISKGWHKADEGEPWIPAEQIRQNVDSFLSKRIDQARADVDTAFFGRLAKACRKAKKEVVQPLTATGAAIYAYWESSENFSRQPTKHEIRAQVEGWQQEGDLLRVKDRHWSRIFGIMAPLFSDI